MNVDELSGADLDWAVQQCEGQRTDIDFAWWTEDYSPSTNWAQGGAIIEREGIGIWWATHFVDGEGNEYGNHWYAEDKGGDHVQTGATPLIAAMRCYVASKQGEQDANETV
tara:strand:+ start:685 stop:1017 length:333 start_codon:yes stop_codon:yes gene_type:complete